MAPTVREKVGNNATGAPVAVATGAGTASGDTLAIFTGYDFYLASHMNAPTITGQTVVDTGVVADAGTDAPHMKLYTCSLSSGGAKTVDFTVGGPGDADLTMIVYVLQGACEVDGTTGTGFSATGTESHLINGASPGTADSLLLGSVVKLFGGATEGWTAPTGMTDLLETLHSAGGQGSAQQVLTASGSTGTRTFVLDEGSGGRAYAGILVAFKASAASTNAPAEAATATATANDATVTTTNIRKVADRGSTQNVTTATTSVVDLAAGAAITVGNYLIARVALDNAGSSGAAPTLSVTDPGGNTWTVAGPANIDPGAANAGSTCYIAYAKITTGLSNGDDVTFTWNVSVPAKAIVVEEWTNIHATTPLAVAATTATGTSTTPSISRTPTAVAQVFYGALAVEGPTGDTYTEDADTTDGAWVTLTRLSTADGTATNNQTINGVAKLVTGTTAQTWNPTITSRDWAQVALVLAAAVATANAAAENAAATSTAQDPTVAIASSAESAAINAAALDATVTTGGATNAAAESATAAAAGLDAAVAVAPTSEAATATAAALDGSTTVSATAEAVVVASAAETPTVLTGTVALAESASAAAAGVGPTIRVAPVVELASATVAALFDASGGSISVELTADSPVLVSAAAHDAAVSTANQTFAAAEDATAIGIVETSTIRVAPVVEHATSAGSAHDATATTSGATTANAENGTSTGTAETSAVMVSPAVEHGAATGAALDATVSTSAATTAAAENAAGVGVANDASVTTSGATSAAAECATLSATAELPAVGAAPSSAVAAITATGNDAAVTTSGQGSALAESAGATAFALDPTTSILFSADIATGSASANSATVSTSAGTTAAAEAAILLASALDTPSAVATVAEFAAAVGTSLDPTATAGVLASAGSAEASGSALALSAVVAVLAECAEAIGASAATVAGLPWPPTSDTIRVRALYTADPPIVT